MLAECLACSAPFLLGAFAQPLFQPPHLAGHSHDDGLTFSFVQLVEPGRERGSTPPQAPTPFSAWDQWVGDQHLLSPYHALYFKTHYWPSW